MAFHWRRFDAQPRAVKEVVWDWNVDVGFAVDPGAAIEVAAALRRDVERRLRGARAEDRRRGRRVRPGGFERFMPGASR